MQQTEKYIGISEEALEETKELRELRSDFETEREGEEVLAA